MQKFHCVHCEQRIEAPSRMAGSRATCPTCKNQIDVPQEPLSASRAPVKTSQGAAKSPKAANGSGKLGSLLCTGLIMAVVIVAGRSCGSIVGRRAAERDFKKDTGRRASEAQQSTLAIHEESYADFVYVRKGGLKMRLPKELSSLIKESNSNENLKLFEKYSSVWATRSVIIKHFVFNAPFEISPAEAVNLSESDIKQQATNGSYSGERSSTVISGLDGIILNARYTTGGQKVNQSILYFGRGSELWEVYVFGVNDINSKSLIEMRDSSFSSIEIID